MALYCIGYELENLENTYATLIEEIETYETWWHCLESTWIIGSPKTVDEVKSHLQQYIGLNDKLVVLEIAGNAAWVGFDKECSDWLTNL
ncbi:MAG TPA: SinR family protein [Nitrosospira sp.]|nr:SinR family protein [Nitrosospira sp.]